MGIASTTGDPMTYYIRTEKDPGQGCDVILIRSVIKTRHKNIEDPTKYVNDDPACANFYLAPSTPTSIDDSDLDTDDHPLASNMELDEVSIDTPSTSPSDDPPDPDDTLPPEDAGVPLSPDDALEELHDHHQMHTDHDHTFHRICGHHFTNGSLVLTVKYLSDLTDSLTLNVPFSILKKDVPIKLAQCIREHVWTIVATASTTHGLKGSFHTSSFHPASLQAI